MYMTKYGCPTLATQLSLPLFLFLIWTEMGYYAKFQTKFPGENQTGLIELMYPRGLRHLKLGLLQGISISMLIRGFRESVLEETTTNWDGKDDVIRSPERAWHVWSTERSLEQLELPSSVCGVGDSTWGVESGEEEEARLERLLKAMQRGWVLAGWSSLI